ncbi:hypothetical protein pb186bvf_016847 [Paramecium bursaria]
MQIRYSSKIFTIQQALKKIDIFGQSIYFNFQNEDVYRTTFGGCMSVGIIALIISFFYSNIISFFAMTQVTSNTQMQYVKDPPAMNLSWSDFMFAVHIDQANFSGNPYFNITLEQRHYYRYPNGTQIRKPKTFIDLVPCTLEHFQPIFQKYGMNITDEFIQNGMGDYLCPSLSTPYPVLQGNWIRQDYKFLKFNVASCQNSSGSNFTWRPKCKTQSELQAFLKEQGSFRFQLLTVNYIFNPQSSSNDIQPFFDQELFFSFVPDTMFVQADIFWRKRSVITDRGILMVPELQNDVLPSRDSGDFRQQISINQLTPGQYAAFYPQMSNYQYKINRNFFRLDQLLSYLGGFLVICNSYRWNFSKIVQSYSQYLQLFNLVICEMANDLFTFKITNETKEEDSSMRNFMWKQTINNIKQLKTNQQSRQKIHNQMNESPHVTDNKIAGAQEESIQLEIQQKLARGKTESIKVKSSKYFVKFKEFIHRQSNIGITIKYIVSEILDREDFLDDQSLLLRKATQQIKKELDVGFILKQLYEIEKLKQVLFYRDQQDLFNYTQKPLIIVNKNRRKQLTRMLSIYRRDGDVFDHDRKIYNNLVNSYRRITSLHVEQMTEEQIRFNSRLINLLGNELPDLIEKELVEYGVGSFNDLEEGNLYQTENQRDERLEIKSDKQDSEKPADEL